MAVRVVNAGGYGGKHIQIDGLAELAQTIKTIKTRISRNALTSGMRAGMAVVARQIRSEINSQSVSTAHEASLKTGMRKLVGSRFKRGGIDKAGRSHATVAKVGFGVGKKSDDRMSRGETSSSSGRRVGVTRTTTHWFVLGTPARAVSQVPTIFKDVVPRAASASGEAAMQKAVTKAKQRMEVLAAKAAKKSRK